MGIESSRRSGDDPASFRLVALAAVSLLVASGVAGATPAVAPSATDAATRQADGATEVRSCTTITEPGEYVLVADVENASETCIEIEADRVRFRGAGHTLDGSDSRFARHTGIRATGASDVVVSNVTLTDWGYAGVYLRGVTESRVRNVTANDSDFGITVRSSREVRIAESNATNNSDAGIDVSTTRESVVVDNVVADNQVGISLTTGSRANRVVGNVIRDNRLGVAVSNSNNNVISDNAFCGNRRAIVRPEQPRGNAFEDNRAC